MSNKVSKTGNPLTWNVPIVNADGTPTAEFMRAWEQQRALNATTKDLSEVEIVPGTGLTGGGALKGDVTLGLADTGVKSGTYGDQTHVPVLTVNKQGQITKASTASLPSATFPESIFAPLSFEELDITLPPDMVLQMQLTGQF